MSKINTLIQLIKSRSSLVPALGDNGLLNWMSDEKYLKLLFKVEMGKELHLDPPLTFNEKLQWLKLHDHNPDYPALVDKIECKKIISNILGSQYVVPLIGKWEQPEDIPFDELPRKVVLKCNHDQGSVHVIEDIRTIDTAKLVDEYKSKLKRSPYPGTREFAYKSIKPYVFAEEYLGKSIVDYKFYCFNGEPKFLYCGQGLTVDHSLKIDFFDMNWNLMPFYRTDYKRLGLIDKPKRFEEMIQIAEVLSKDIPFVRIDLFEVNDRVYFSEFTVCPASGLMPFVPPQYDTIVGEWLTLPTL